MNFEYVGTTDLGLSRTNNEDAIGLLPEHGVAVLADGMGGYNAGEIASEMAVDFVKSGMARVLQNAGSGHTEADMRSALEACVVAANQSIHQAASTNAAFSGMGTTLVVALFNGARVLVAHVGDSRCYVWRRGELTQLTRDHSLLQEQLDAGLVTQAQAKVAGYKNLITRALGVQAHVRVDLVEHPPLPGDVYLLCSDGLTDMVDDADLARILSAPNSLSERADALVAAANAAGGADNIAVVLVGAAPAPGALGFMSRLIKDI